MHTRLDNAARVIAAVNKELGQVQEMGRSMRDLQQFLQSQNYVATLANSIARFTVQELSPVLLWNAVQVQNRKSWMPYSKRTMGSLGLILNTG